MEIKILITGCAGFIASAIAKKLLSQGKNVIGIDNFNDYYDVRLKEHHLLELKKFPNFTFSKMDIENTSELDSLFRNNKFSSVFNLAARAGVRYSLINPGVYYSTNVIGTLNILEMMKKYDINRLIIASTSSVYAGHSTPFREDMPVDHPISPYSASKKAAEVLCYTYHYQYKFNISVLRYFTVYGPAGRPDMSILRFIKWIDEGEEVTVTGDGNQTRDFTYVDDIAEGSIAALNIDGYEIINLGGGKEPKSMNYVIDRMGELMHKKPRIKYAPFSSADMHDTAADTSKANRILGWIPKVDLDEGLRRTVEWYNLNREWIRKLDLNKDI